MAQMFHPYRIMLVLILSVILALNMTQLTQAKTSHNSGYPYPDYPTKDQATNAVQYYYNIIGPFSEKNVLGSIDSITYGSMYGTGTFVRFPACVQYRFSEKSSPEVIHTARHTFTFQYEPERIRDNKGWHVVKMDVNTTC